MKTLMMILMALAVMGASECEEGDGGDVDSDVDSDSDTDNDTDTDTDTDGDSDSDSDGDCDFTCQYSGLSACQDGLYKCADSSCPTVAGYHGNCCGPYGC